MTKRVVILSAFQDYRTRKRASIQQVADGLVLDGYDVTFLSTRFSHLSRLTGDSRNILNDRRNRMETVNGVHCYLWKTPFHPFHTGRPLLDRMAAPLFDLYASWPNATVDRSIRDADFIIVESSVAVIYLPRLRRLNPTARIIYYATDRLDTVGAHPHVQAALVASQQLIDHFCLRSTKMAPHFAWATGPLYLAQFGVNPDQFGAMGPSPYSAPINLVSVGSMLFDPGFFAVAERFPKARFHVIGCGTRFDAPANVMIYDEMSFRDTLPYIKYASVGLAPYRWAPGCEYLDESSLKLAQFGYFGIPAVCPDFAAGHHPSRSGYKVGDIDSLASAIDAALGRMGSVRQETFPTWREVAARIVEPERAGAVRISP